MANAVVNFSCHNFLIADNPPSLDSFDTIGPEGVFIVDGNKRTTWKIKKEANYVWMSGRYGAPLPYSEEVINVETNEIVHNPRSANLAELRNQWFALYHYDLMTLYMTRYAKSYLPHFLQKELKKDVLIKNIYKSREEFINSLESIKDVRFVMEEDLLTRKDELFADVNDKLGLGNPKQLKIEMDFGYARKCDRFVNWYSHATKNYENGLLKGLVVAGKCKEKDRLIESVFNIDTVGQVIRCMCEKDGNGMIQESLLEECLIKTLKGE